MGLLAAGDRLSYIRTDDAGLPQPAGWSRPCCCTAHIVVTLWGDLRRGKAGILAPDHKECHNTKDLERCVHLGSTWGEGSFSQDAQENSTQNLVDV